MPYSSSVIRLLVRLPPCLSTFRIDCPRLKTGRKRFHSSLSTSPSLVRGCLLNTAICAACLYALYSTLFLEQLFIKKYHPWQDFSKSSPAGCCHSRGEIIRTWYTGSFFSSVRFTLSPNPSGNSVYIALRVLRFPMGPNHLETRNTLFLLLIFYFWAEVRAMCSLLIMFLCDYKK